MKCLNCNKQLDNLRAKYCSDKCRMVYKRRTKRPEQNDPNNTKRPEQKQPEQLSYTIIKDEKVYSRRAVIYDHEKEGITNSQGYNWTS